MEAVPAFTDQLPDTDVLRAMRLHDITHDYEAAGLAARFEAEVDARDYPPETVERLQSALSLSLMAHEGQERGKWTYATHTLRVANRLIGPDHFDVSDPDTLIAALLHDTVEDQPERILGIPHDPSASLQDRIALRGRALTRIAELYGESAARIINAVTNPLYDKTGMTVDAKRAIYQEHAITALDVDPQARVVKLSDLIDNFCGIKYNEKTPVEILNLADKYYPVVAHALTYWLSPEADTPLSEHGKTYARDSLIRGLERYSQRLHEQNRPSPELDALLGRLAIRTPQAS